MEVICWLRPVRVVQKDNRDCVPATCKGVVSDDVWAGGDDAVEDRSQCPDCDAVPPVVTRLSNMLRQEFALSRLRFFQLRQS